MLHHPVLLPVRSDHRRCRLPSCRSYLCRRRHGHLRRLPRNTHRHRRPDTYSMPFKHLQDKGWNVDPELLLYAELLDNKILPLSPEDFPDGFIHTKATVNILEICMRYESEYVGGRTDAVIGMHPDLLIRVIEESLKRLGIRDLDNPCQHRFLTMIISIPENKLPSYSVNVFIDQLMFEIRQALIVQGFELSIQYTFEFKPYTVSGGSSTGESGGTGGSSGGRGSGASTPTQPSSFKEPLKDNSAMSKQIQQESVELQYMIFRESDKA